MSNCWGNYDHVLVVLWRKVAASRSPAALRRARQRSYVAEKALGIIQNAALAACIQAPIIFPLVPLPPTESLWGEAVHWSCDALNHTATTANPGSKSPYEMLHGTAAPSSMHPFLGPEYCRWTTTRSRFPWPRVVFTSARASTTQVTLRGGSRGQKRWSSRGM